MIFDHCYRCLRSVSLTLVRFAPWYATIFFYFYKTPSAAGAGGRGKNDSSLQIDANGQFGFFSFGAIVYLAEFNS